DIIWSGISLWSVGVSCPACGLGQGGWLPGDTPLLLPAAFMTMVLIFLHTFWGILFFHGCEHRRWWEITAVIIMHLAVSGSTFCNPLYMGSLVPSYLLMATAATWAYLLSGGSAQNLRRFLLCKSCSVMGTGDPAGSSGYLDQRWGGERVPQGLEQGHHSLGCQTRGDAGVWGCGQVVASAGGSIG
uniref:Gamma-secretase subunit APH-1 n=1 Tax=Buteo japonicus TaxID=224669 RepID=A0A8C0BCB2_9AVES